MAVKVAENMLIKQTSAEGVDLIILEVGSGDCLSGLPCKTLTPGLRSPPVSAFQVARIPGAPKHFILLRF